MEQELAERVINERKGKDMSKFLLTGLTVTAQSLIDRHQVPYLGKRPCIVLYYHGLKLQHSCILYCEQREMLA